MNTILRHILFTFLLSFFSFTSVKSKDIYFVFYATIDGKSGHAGIAIDNYKIVIKTSYNEKNERISKYDTIKDGTLTYYDLWPEKDDFNAINVNVDVPAKYYKLPAASWEDNITVSSLITNGIPHEEFYPADGLIKIPSSPKKDSVLKQFIETQISRKKPFNVRSNNCADFVKMAIEKYCNCTINAEESIVLKQSTTPNRLYQEIIKLNNITIIKDAGDKAKGSFTMERLLKRTNTNN